MSRDYLISYTERIKIRDAYSQWLTDLASEGDWFVTLNFNRNAGTNFVQRQLAKWAGRVDRTYLGHNWSKKESVVRSSGLGAIENLLSNTHIHLVFKPAPKVKTKPPSLQIAPLRDHWQKLEPHGQCFVREIYNTQGLHYIFKQLHNMSHAENCVVVI